MTKSARIFLPVAFILMLGVTACAPRASGSLPVPGSVSNAQIVSCARLTLADLGANNGLWRRDITLEDVDKGLLQSGNYPDENVMGYRLSLAVRRSDSVVIEMKVKASGPSQGDIGADAAVVQFKQALASCLQVAE